MSQNDGFGIPHYFKPLIVIFLTISWAIGVVGNVMVIIVIIKTKEMRNSTNIFLANLAIADLMVLFVDGLYGFIRISLKLNILDLNEGICRIVPYFNVTVNNVSVLTILAIGLERYYAVCKPLQATYVCTKNRAVKISLFVWALAALSSSQNLLLFYYRHEENTNGLNKKPACRVRLITFWETIVLTASRSAFIFLPPIILIVIYFKISHQFKKATESSINIAATKHRRRVVTMLAIIVVVFFTCTLPIRVVHLLIYLLPKEWLGEERIKNLNIFCATLAIVHSAVNPILYNLMSQRFRAGYKRVCCDMMRGLSKWRSKFCSSKGSNTVTTAQVNTLSV